MTKWLVAAISNSKWMAIFTVIPVTCKCKLQVLEHYTQFFLLLLLSLGVHGIVCGVRYMKLVMSK